VRSLLLAAALLVATAAAIPAAAVAANTSFRNPVAPETASGDDSPDPWIFRSGGRYWLTYTTQGRIIVRRARTLAGLASAHPKQLWPRPGDPRLATRTGTPRAVALNGMFDAAPRDPYLGPPRN
jgi:GH43 family beta-xylosidase